MYRVHKACLFIWKVPLFPLQRTEDCNGAANFGPTSTDWIVATEEATGLVTVILILSFHPTHPQLQTGAVGYNDNPLISFTLK